jgi:Ca2+-binding EF-hand superfamily protein
MRATHLFAAVLAVFGFALPAGAAERDIQDVVYLGDKGPVLMRLHVRIDGKPLVDVWENFMGQLFAFLDVDADGVLNKAEASRVPSIPMLFNNGPGFAGQRPNIAENIDKNQDGKITKEELMEWYRRNGAAPFQFRTGGGTVQGQFRLVIAGQGEPLSADAINQKLFALLDANKDGKLSREELTRAPAVLHKLDLDDDEMVSVQEMSGNPDRDQGTDVNVVFAIAQEEASTNNGPFMLVKSGEANKELPQRLLNHYGHKGQKTSAKTLTREEIGLDEASFKQLDMDEDGKLDREELARFAQRPPGLALRVRLGKKGDNEAGIEMVSAKDDLSPLAKSMPPGTDGTLRLELGTAQIELACGVTPQPALRARQQYLAQFRRADKDNNGYLDKKEAMQSPLYRNAFDTLDRDGDGKLFEKEIVAYLDQMGKLQNNAFRSCASLAVKDQGRGLFDLVDTNGDGRLSVRELRQMVKLIDQLDRDGDGQISPGEIPHKYRVDVRHGPAQGNQFTPRTVVLSRMALNNQSNLPERTGPRWFQKMDLNHDGDVSHREFLGTDKEFRQIDRDGDGLISVEEAKQADEFFRKEKQRKP